MAILLDNPEQVEDPANEMYIIEKGVVRVRAAQPLLEQPEHLPARGQCPPVASAVDFPLCPGSATRCNVTSLPVFFMRRWMSLCMHLRSAGTAAAAATATRRGRPKAAAAAGCLRGRMSSVPAAWWDPQTSTLVSGAASCERAEAVQTCLLAFGFAPPSSFSIQHLLSPPCRAPAARPHGSRAVCRSSVARVLRLTRSGGQAASAAVYSAAMHNAASGRGLMCLAAA